jgi:uncharacterized protein
MRAMRKANREITGKAEIRAVIQEAEVCRIGMCDNGTPYVVPVHFGLGKNCLYIHCAPEGKKIDILRDNNLVCFEMDLLREVKKGAKACDFSARYESVIGLGRAVLLEGPREKRSALDRIMEHYGARGPFDYPDDVLAKTAVIRIDIESMTGKRHE